MFIGTPIRFVFLKCPVVLLDYLPVMNLEAARYSFLHFRVRAETATSASSETRSERAQRFRWAAEIDDADALDGSTSMIAVDAGGS